MTTIGVFDSGFGGLTVLRALLRLMPKERYVYLGDTARLPYGSKSRETIGRYAVSSARFLLEQGAEVLVIACNTATALALDEIRAAVVPVPVIGVIQPGSQAAVRASRKAGERGGSGAEVLVLATAATVQSHAYTAALDGMGMAAVEKACPLLVPLVEEGWIDHPVTREVVRIYLAEALREHPMLTTLLLGCTHYPLLREVFAETLAAMGRPLTIIDSAEATAETVAAGVGTGVDGTTGECVFFATDSVEKFQRLGSHFLGQPLAEVRLVDLGG